MKKIFETEKFFFGKSSELLEFDIEKKTQEILEEYFYKPYQEFLDMEIKADGSSFKLNEIISSNLKNIEEAPDSEAELKSQKEFIGAVVDKLHKIPVGTWSLSLKQTLETGEANCSNLSAVLAMIIESNKRISGVDSIKYVEPCGHIACVVHFIDGSIYFADARSGNFFEITQDIDIDEREEMVIYENKKLSDKLPVKFLPAMRSNKKGFAHIFANNISLIPNLAKGKLGGILQTKTEEQRRFIVEEAKVSQREMELTESKSKKYRDLAYQIGKPIYDYMESSDYSEDIDRLRKLHDE